MTILEIKIGRELKAKVSLSIISGWGSNRSICALVGIDDVQLGTHGKDPNHWICPGCKQLLDRIDCKAAGKVIAYIKELSAGKVVDVDNDTWEIILNQVELEAAGAISEEVLREKMAAAFPQLSALLINKAVAVAYASARATEFLRSHLEFTMFGETEAEIVKKMLNKSSGISQIAMKKAFREYYPDWKAKVFSRVEEVVARCISVKEIREIPLEKLRNLRQSSIPINLAKDVLEINCLGRVEKGLFGMFIVAVSSRVQALLPELEKELEDERIKQVQWKAVMASKVEADLEEARLKKMKNLSRKDKQNKRLQDVLARPRIAVLLYDVSCQALPIESREEADLLQDGILVVFEDQVFIVVRKKGGATKLTESAAKIIDGTPLIRLAETKKSRPKVANEIWVEFRGSKLKVFLLPVFDHGKIVESLALYDLKQGSRFVVEGEDNVFVVGVGGVLNIGAYRRLTNDEKKAAKA